MKWGLINGPHHSAANTTMASSLSEEIQRPNSLAAVGSLRQSPNDILVANNTFKGINTKRYYTTHLMKREQTFVIVGE